MRRRIGLTLLVLSAGLLVLCACTEPTAGKEVHFHSDQYHLEANLPPGWAATEGPTSLAKPFTGWVALNSWGEDGFWAPQVESETDSGMQASYGPKDVLGQLPPGGAYVVLTHVSDGPRLAPEEYGPEYEQQDLSGLWNMTDCREGDTHAGATVVSFLKWGRSLRLEVYCAPDGSDATAAEVNALLDSWRFDEVPAGDFGWASLEAREQLPASVQPDRFPLLAGGPRTSYSQRETTVWATSGGYLEAEATPGTQIPGATVVITFTTRWDAPSGGSLPSDCPPDRCHWWRFEARPDGEVALVEEGGAPDWETVRPTSTPTASPTATPAPGTEQEEAFSTSRSALADYEPGQNARTVVTALSQDCEAWLSAGHDPATLSEALRALPKLELPTAEVEVGTLDLNDDGLPDAVVEPQFLGLPILACLAQEGEGYVCQPMVDPATLERDRPLMQSGVLSQDLVGEGRPETVVTYTLSGGSGWTELLNVYNWVERTSPELVFHAELVNWAGRSRWRFEPDPTSPDRQQIVLTCPHLYAHGFDHKMVNHPIGRQVWRWDGGREQFVRVEKSVDMSQGAWGPEMTVTVEDQLRWLTNEGETAFRAGRYQEALRAYDKALALAEAEGWRPATDEPDWVGVLRFRRGESLAHLGRASEALDGMENIASDYEEDLLGEIAEAFLAGYGDGSGPDATEKGCDALQELEERVSDHFYYERGGALRFPMTATGILICEPDPGAATPADTSWPRVGGFEGDLEW